jgi:hypothetical protein
MIAKTRSNAVVRSSEKGRITLDIISTLKSFPAILLEQTLDRVGSTFDLTMEFRLINNNNNNNNNSGSKQNHEQNGLITIKSKS